MLQESLLQLGDLVAAFGRHRSAVVAGRRTLATGTALRRRKCVCGVWCVCAGGASQGCGEEEEVRGGIRLENEFKFNFSDGHD